MQTHVGVEVWLNALLMWELDGDEWLGHAPKLRPGERTPVLTGQKTGVAS